jgi:hypothetical protein
MFVVVAEAIFAGGCALLLGLDAPDGAVDVTGRGALNGRARFLLVRSDAVRVGGIVALGGGKSRSRYPAM